MGGQPWYQRPNLPPSHSEGNLALVPTRPLISPTWSHGGLSCMWLLCSKGYSCFCQCVEVAPSDPNKFFPKMFLTKHANIDASGQHFEFVPFGFGRRSCPSYTFALQVSYLTLAQLLQGFEFTTPLNMPVDMTIGLDITLPKATPLEVLLNPRLALELYQWQTEI